MSRPACGWMFAVVLVACGGCRLVGPNHVPPCADVQPEFRHLGDSGVRQETMDLAAWWTVFDDPVLNALIDEAARQNISLQEACWRVMEARAQRGVIRADLGPQATGDAGYSFQKFSTAGGQFGAIGGGIPGGIPGFRDTQNNLSLGSSLQWELDVFGRLRRNVEAADADIGATIWDYRDVLVMLQADVAVSYVNARTFQQRLDIARRNLESQKQTLKQQETIREAGKAGDLEVAQAASNVYSTESTIPTLMIGYQQAVNRISFLLGRTPGYVDQLLSEAQPIPTAGQEIAIGIPADLLRRRPDIRAAERRVAAQNARIGVAIGDFYPKYSITGTFGLDAQKMSTLFTGNAVGALVGPSVQWNLFSFGRVRMNVRVQEAREAQTILQYQNVVLAAAEEVDNALIAYDQQIRRRQSLEQAVAAFQRSVEVSEAQQEEGLLDFLPVLDAQRSLLQFQDQLAENRAQVSLELIQLFRALAGGWQAPQTMNAVEITAAEAIPLEEVPADVFPAQENSPATGEGAQPAASGESSSEPSLEPPAIPGE